MTRLSTKQKAKLCWNCEGNVSREASNCPYCGVYLRRDEDEELDFEAEKQENAYPPPYDLSETEEEEIPEAPYQATEVVEETPIFQTEETEEVPPSFSGWKNVAIPLGLLLSGSLFFLFSTFLLLFSRNGVFTLQWDSSYWFVYLILSLPLLFFGWRTLEKLDENVPSSKLPEPDKADLPNNL